MKTQPPFFVPVFIIANIFCLRMLGLFMILPVFSDYAHHLTDATPSLIGLALGIYGLSQAVLQLPLGILSDRLGRKPILQAGLSVFVLGSLVAGFATSIYGVILGRFLQGAGAIGSTLIATIADVTDEKDRTKAMAMIGVCIGLSFSIALFLGPILAQHFDVQGIFMLTAGLGVLGMVVVMVGIPSAQRTASEASWPLFARVLRDPQLIYLDIGIFIQHAILTASFVVIPILLNRLSIPHELQWRFYLPVLLGGFAFSIPMIVLAEKYQQLKNVFLLAISMVALSQLGLALLPSNQIEMMLLLGLFFVGFNFLEASLPSLISKCAPKQAKGTAMGIYSFSQFFGLFCGGSIGGLLYGHHSASAVFLLCAILAFAWLTVAVKLQTPESTGQATVDSLEIGH